MIRHLVAVRFKQNTSKRDIIAIAGALAELETKLYGIADFAFRENISPETALIRGFNHIFWFDFDTAEDRDEYLEDPQHKAVGAQLVAMTEGGLDGLFVWDVDL